MGTRSLIGKELENGQVKYVYCHWDGYLENNGVLLFENYNRDNIDELVGSNNLTSLSDKPHSCKFSNVSDAEPVSKDEYLDINNDMCWSEFRYLYTKENKWVFVSFDTAGVMEVKEALDFYKIPYKDKVYNMNKIVKVLINQYYSQEGISSILPYINISNANKKVTITIYNNYHGYMLGKYLYITLILNENNEYVLKTLLNKHDLNLDCIKYKDINVSENGLLEIFTKNLKYLCKRGN